MRRGVARHPRYAEMEMSVNNRKILGLVEKIWALDIETAQLEVKRWGRLRAQDYCGERLVELSDQLKVCRVWYVIVSLSKQPPERWAL